MGLLTGIMSDALNKSVKEGPTRRKAEAQAKKDKTKTPDLDTLIELAHDAYSDECECGEHEGLGLSRLSNRGAPTFKRRTLSRGLGF